MKFTDYILLGGGGKFKKLESPSVIKSFLKNPDDHKILIEVVDGEIVIRIRRKS